MEGIQELLSFLSQFGVPVPKVVATIGFVLAVVQFLKTKVAPNLIQGKTATIVAGSLGLVLSLLQFYTLGLVPAVVGCVSVVAGSMGLYEALKFARGNATALPPPAEKPTN